MMQMMGGSLLDQMVEKGEIPNVLLFVGAKETTAKDFAKKLMGPAHVAKIDSGHHPDLHTYEIEGKSGTHTAASMQHLIKEAFFPPLEAKVKVFVIDEAHRMLPSSSNSLLKTLEEPSFDSYMILLSNKPELLLPTLLSRCRRVTFAPSTTSVNEAFTAPLDSIFKALRENDASLLLKEIARLEEIILEEEVGSPLYFQKIDILFEIIITRLRDVNIRELIEESYLALERHLKLRTIFLNFFLLI